MASLHHYSFEGTSPEEEAVPPSPRREGDGHVVEPTWEAINLGIIPCQHVIELHRALTMESGRMRGAPLPYLLKFTLSPLPAQR